MNAYIDYFLIWKVKDLQARRIKDEKELDEKEAMRGSLETHLEV